MVVDEAEDMGKVSIGSRVTVVRLDDNTVMPVYTIVGSQEANVMEKKISEDSPFGKALMGAKEGDTVTVDAPRGAINYRVEKIER